MASNNLDFTSITNNRPGYAIPITFIGIFILIPIVTAFINKYKESTSISVTFNNKLILILMLIIVVMCIIAIFVEFSNCIKYDIQMKIGERLLNLCGGSQYYQRESPDELIASMIYKKNTDPVKVEGSPIRYNIAINYVLNIIFLSIFLIYSYIILNRTILLIFDSDPSIKGKVPLITFLTFKRFTITKSIYKKIIGGIIVFSLICYIVLYLLASINEFTKLGMMPKNAVKKLKTMNLIKYTALKVGFIGFAGFLLWLAKKFEVGESKVAGTEFMQEWESSNILKLLFAFMIGMAVLIFGYKSFYEKLPATVNEYMLKCDSLNSQILPFVTTAPIPRFKNILYKNILELEPNVSDPVDTAIRNRSNTLYQYIKHNNGKELLQLENAISSRDLEAIRSKMKELRNYKNIRDTFGKYNKTIFSLFITFIIVVFYIIFNYNYKTNISQVTLLTVISIVILIIITCIFGWFSNAIIMS